MESEPKQQFGAEGPHYELPSDEALRERIRTAALGAYEAGENNFLAPSVVDKIAEGSEVGFRELYGQEEVSPNALRSLLQVAASDAARAFGKVQGIIVGKERMDLSEEAQQENERRFKIAQSVIPPQINQRLAGEIYNLLYRKQYEGDGAGEYRELPNRNAENLEIFLKETFSFGIVAEATARQLGIEVPQTKPEEVIASLAETLTAEKDDYGLSKLKELTDFIKRGNGLPSKNKKDLILADMLLRLANASWAGGQVAVATYAEKRGRLERATFDTPEGRSRTMYESFKNKYGDPVAFYLVAFENAKDYANLID